MPQSVTDMALEARQAALLLACAGETARNKALLAIAQGIDDHLDSILEANRQDVQQATEEGLSAPLLSRLKLTREKCARMSQGLVALRWLPDPLGKVDYAKELSPGLNLFRVSCPIGVIGVIFESRPDALVQIASLCLKTGNAVLLKSGREAARWRSFSRLQTLAACPKGAADCCIPARTWRKCCGCTTSSTSSSRAEATPLSAISCKTARFPFWATRKGFATSTWTILAIWTWRCA